MAGNFIPIVSGPPQSSPQRPKTSGTINVVSGLAANKLGATPFSPSTPRPSPIGAPTTTPTFSALDPHSAQNHGQPKITFQKEGDRITQIRVQCPCGQIIELNCLY
jgi:hypothetical protein